MEFVCVLFLVPCIFIIEIMDKSKIICIVGPTASGKTALAIRLAKKFKGEIISADSRQVYRGMDIGTDKPFDSFDFAQDRPAQGKPKKIEDTIIIRGIPHHLIDIVEPNEEFTLGHWLELAKKAITEIEQRNHIPIIAGGTGLYISALLYGFEIPVVPPNPKLRKKLEAEIKKYGTKRLAKKILLKDPQAAIFLDTKNPRRLIRAWEVMEATGKKFSQIRKRSAQPKYNTLIVGLTLPKNDIERKIALRLKKQFKKGLKKEVLILSKKYNWNLPSMNTLGYSQWKSRSHNNSLNDKDVFKAILKDTIRYSKRQMTWFNKMNQIVWLDTANKKPRTRVNSVRGRRLENQAVKYVRKFLKMKNSK